MAVAANAVVVVAVVVENDVIVVTVRNPLFTFRMSIIMKHVSFLTYFAGLMLLDVALVSENNEDVFEPKYQRSLFLVVFRWDWDRDRGWFWLTKDFTWGTVRFYVDLWKNIKGVFNSRGANCKSCLVCETNFLDVPTKRLLLFQFLKKNTLLDSKTLRCIRRFPFSTLHRHCRSGEGKCRMIHLNDEIVL
jgi:hypothetical protein